MTLTVLPAYGRAYQSEEQIRSDYAANKDFKIVGGGPYINKQDAEQSTIRSLRILFGPNDERSVVIEVEQFADIGGEGGY